MCQVSQLRRYRPRELLEADIEPAALLKVPSHAVVPVTLLLQIVSPVTPSRTSRHRSRALHRNTEDMGLDLKTHAASTALTQPLLG